MKNEKLMKELEALLSDEQRQELEQAKAKIVENLNSQKLFMNPKTGTVQSDQLWIQEKKEIFDKNELVEVKLVDDKWVRVN